MPLAFLSLPPFPPPPSPPLSSFPKLKHTSSINLFLNLRSHPLSTSTAVSAIGPDGKYYPTPSDDDPPEAPEDSMHGVNKFQQIQRQAARARKIQEEEYNKDLPVFLKALEETEEIAETSGGGEDSGDDLFGEIDKAIALKREEFVKKGLIKPRPEKKNPEAEIVDELEPEEVVDLEEIDGLKGLTGTSDEGGDENEEEEAAPTDFDGESSNSFDIDFDVLGRTKSRIVEPKFKMSLAELLDDSKVVPISVYGNLEIEINGISHDSRVVESGDLFVCCVGKNTDGHLYLSEADKRGAVAVVASKEINIDDTLGCKALVIVEDTNTILSALAASFFRHPSRGMSVIGITGTSGKTTTSYLIKGMYEAMGLRTGMLSSVANFVHGDNKLENTTIPSDSVSVQKLMAKMVHNGTEALVMEASSRGHEVDFDISVFTNLMGDDDKDSKVELFSRMVDPARHRKIVNLDDPSVELFIGLGDPEVPVVTFAVENKKADVHPLRFELSLFETQVLVNTPQGILEISSGLLGRHNVYNILAAVAVGIAVGAPLEEIVRGVEEVDGVPGRCELIDEEQAFGVIVDHADTPDGLSRLLDYVRELGPRRIITGCVGESERGKRPLMTKIATDKSDVTILTSDNQGNEDPLDILDDMLSGVGWTMQDYLKHGENDYYPPLPNGHRLFLHDIRRVAVRCAVAMGEEGDVVVVAGKGHRTYQIEGDKKEFFDDRDECREALQYVDELHQAGIDTSEFPWRLPESH